ncbi:hypothetical protein HKD37_01G001151 [Glycine soja]
MEWLASCIRSAKEEEKEEASRGSIDVFETPVIWKAPRAGMYKANFDASVRKGVGVGMRLILRDD